MRRRSSAPGRLRPDGRRQLLLLAVALAVVLVGCGSATPSAQPGDPSESAGAPSSPDVSLDTPQPTSSEPGAGTPGPMSDDPTSEPAPGGSATTGGAMACSGSDENRDFFASMAAAVDWPVYCPILPEGWFVEDGSYRLAGGGWMEITYDGRDNAQLLLRQGFFCEAADGCVPPGQDVDAAMFGDRAGRLVAGVDGSWSVVADGAGQPSWLLVVAGLGETEARKIAGDVHLVD